MALVTNFTQKMARTPGDPKVLTRGPGSLTRADRLARWLAWFSFGLGVIEIVAPERITRAIGLDGKEALIRWYGLREISAGIPTMSIDKQVGLMMRIAGDGLDLATVAPALRRDNPQRKNARFALASLVFITALDVIATNAVLAAHRRTPPPPRDYSGRSGFPLGIEASRGIARRDFQIPPDFHAPGRVGESVP